MACEDCKKLEAENIRLKGEVSLLKGGIAYLEKSKVPWLEGQITRMLKDGGRIHGNQES